MRRLATFLLLPITLGAQAMPAPAAAKRVVDSLARDFIAQDQAPSVAIAVLRGNDTISIAAFGKANLELDVPATPETVYRIGSVTKQFTSSAVMQLVEQGKVRLEDSIAVYLPGLPGGVAGRDHRAAAQSHVGYSELYRTR